MDTGANGLSSGVEHAAEGAEGASTSTTVAEVETTLVANVETTPVVEKIETKVDAAVVVEPARKTLLDDVLSAPVLRTPESFDNAQQDKGGFATVVGATETPSVPKVIEPPVASIVVPPTNVSSPTPFSFHPPEGFEKIPQSLFHYSPAHCKGRSVFGILVDALDVQLRDSSMKAIVIQLVEPTLVLLQDGKTVVEIPDGNEVFLFADFYLRPLIRRALDKERVAEIWLRPSKSIIVDGGGIMYGWEQYYGKTYPRSKIKRLPKGNLVL